MNWLWLLLVMLIFWWLFTAAKNKSRANATNRTEAGSGRHVTQAGTRQPSNTAEAAQRGERNQTVTVHLDVDKLIAKANELDKKSMKWSGKINGPLPIKTLTFNQNHCLSDAAFGKRIVQHRPGENYGDAPENIAFHSSRTVDTLVKHGFLMGDGKGAFVCTDLGLRAFETLPYRLS